MDKAQILAEINQLEAELQTIEAQEVGQSFEPEQSTTKQVFDLDLDDLSFTPDAESELLSSLEETSEQCIYDENMKAQLRQVLKGLEEQFETLPSKAVLGIFVAGILFGKIVR